MTMPSIASVSSGQTIPSAGWNTSFNTVRNHYNANAVELSGSQTLTGVKTFSATPVLSSGMTVTGNSTITGTLTGLTGVTLASGNLVFGAASAKIIPGATSLLFRDTADANTNVSITDAGVVTVRAGLTVTAGGATVTAGGLTVSAGTTAVQALTCTTLAPSGLITTSAAIPFAFAATAKIVAGATAWSIKDSGDGVTAFGLTGTGTSTAVTMACGSSGTITITGPGSANLTLTSSNARLSATAGLILLGTDGTNPISGTATLGFPCMPWVNATPTGILSSAKIGAFQLDEANGCVAVWTATGWRKLVHASY